MDSVLTEKQVREDIDYTMKKIRERHPAWLEEKNDHVDAVEAKYLEEIANLSSYDEITVLDEWRIISRIMHEMYDGHTSVFARSGNFRYINDFSLLKEYGFPKSINGENSEDVFQKFLSVYQYETESYAEGIFVNNVIINETYLTWIGLDVSNGVDFVFETPEGDEEIHYDFVPLSEVTGFDKNASEKWVYYEIDEENGIGIFTLTDCSYNSEYRQCVKEFFESVEASGVEDIIVDLRYNGGGSSMVGDEFIRYLNVDEYNAWNSDVRFGNYLRKNRNVVIHNNKANPQFDGNVYVLTNSETFSAAMDFTMYILDNDIGEVVGEASGNKPDSYGDVAYFTTPNSKLTIGVSVKRWYRIDRSKADELLEPDYPCEPKEALDKAYEVIKDKRNR
ncbi:MAG: hypothetical protein K5776_07815 [Lachnospiraceae bacterium]|nr:hypothetical protein [Lachnospiraceae bacterium]